MEYIVDSSDLTSVANAIRAKGGTASQIQFPTGFVSAIQNIPSGGNEVPEKDVNFIDYDGTILYSYTAQEAQELSALPANPSHTGLTARGWNWSLADIKTFMTSYTNAVMHIGQMYATATGATEIDFTLRSADRLSPVLALWLNGTATVDWGDGSTAETVTGSSISSYVFVQHTYASVGNYTIAIKVISGELRIGKDHNDTAVLLRINNDAYSYSYAEIYSSGITAIRIGASTTIGDYAFENCFSLKSVIISNDETTGWYQYADNAFLGCISLKSITIPTNITKITDSSFKDCTSLRSVSIPRSVTYIDRYSFDGCTSLEHVIVPDSVTNFSLGIFQNCKALKTAVVKPQVSNTYSRLFADCYMLEYVSISDTMTKIAGYAFGDCKSLREVEIPSGVTEIGEQAFESCNSLTRITIPSGVTRIGTYGLKASTSLREIHMLPSTPPTLGSYVLPYTLTTDFVIYVPYSADHSILEAYQTASGWSTYASYIQEEPQP